MKVTKTAIATEKYIANPGCHASGMIACIAPLIKAGFVPADYPFTITSLTGYSGGGKKMIGQYESNPRIIFSMHRVNMVLVNNINIYQRFNMFVALVKRLFFIPIVDDIILAWK